MIVVGMGDGLGNQMFQYAFYYSMKKRYPNSKILIDDKFFYGSVNTHNGIELAKVFKLDIPSCTRRQALALADYHVAMKKQHPILNLFWGMRKGLSGAKESFLTVDDATAFYKEVYELNPLRSYYLRGNWINEKYFIQYRDDIIKIFEFPIIDDKSNEMFSKDIEMSNSVSLHLRAGDYLNNPDLEQLGNDYYDDAIEFIKKKVGNEIRLFIFSDDKNYAQNRFSYINNKVIIDCNRGENSYRDMQLMSLCKHNIIANSTFSFWGAYLNRNNDKIVIAPKKASRNCMNSFACENWILL